MPASVAQALGTKRRRICAGGSTRSHKRRLHPIAAGRRADPTGALRREVHMFRLDYLSCILTVISTILIGKRLWQGWIVAGANSIIICVIGLRTAQFGFVPANLLCIGLYANNLWNWRPRARRVFPVRVDRAWFRRHHLSSFVTSCCAQRAPFPNLHRREMCELLLRDSKTKRRVQWQSRRPVQARVLVLFMFSAGETDAPRFRD